MKKVSLLIVLVAVSFCFAGEGIVGDKIIGLIEKLFGDNAVAMSIYTALLGILSIGLRVLLKKVPTSMQGIVSAIFWKIAAILFGSGVVMDNHKDKEYVKKELVKKYPYLAIEMKPE